MKLTTTQVSVHEVGQGCDAADKRRSGRFGDLVDETNADHRGQ